jgi:hypothetical protein
MLHGSPTRPAHRAAPEGLAQLMRQTVAATGLHRQPLGRAQRRAPREPQRAGQRLMTGLAGLIVLSICGLVAFFIVADERRGHAQPAGEPPASPWAISSRDVDPQPLSLDEVFPGSEIQLVAGNEPYRVTMTHIDTDCEVATTGALGQVLTDQDCSQVVRARMTAPYGGYQVTAGIFNLADDVAAAEAGRQVRDLVETGGGSFATMAAGAAPGSDPRAAPDSQVGWHDRGHYLLYCVITRPDGRAIGADDRYAERITVDLLDSYLAEETIGARALAP